VPMLRESIRAANRYLLMLNAGVAFYFFDVEFFDVIYEIFPDVVIAVGSLSHLIQGFNPRLGRLLPAIQDV